jgi:nitric oxide reductase activation protein
MRHAAHTLEHRKADKSLMLILTDGEPADVDVEDSRLLIDDARQAVRELDAMASTPIASTSIPRRMSMWPISSGMRIR